jgi:hypothetical protein
MSMQEACMGGREISLRKNCFLSIGYMVFLEGKSKGVKN